MTKTAKLFTGFMTLALGMVFLLSAVTAKVAIAAPGSPGVPEAPTVIFSEDFENNPSTGPVDLTNYTGASSMTYSASAPWLTNCNGEVLFFAMDDSEFANSNCSVGDGTNITMAFDAVRRLAYALGTVSGSSPSTNRALTAYTDAGNVYVDPGANLTQLETATTINLPSGTRRFVISRVDAAAINCTWSGTVQHKLIFFLIDGSNVRQINQQPVNACTDPAATTVTPPSLQSNGAIAANTGDIRVGSFITDRALLSDTSSLRLRVRNQEGSGQGNDNAIDNIRLVDASPKLDKSFSPTKLSVNQTSRMTFTVTNTTDLLAKQGWSFTDMLPDNLLIAENPNAESDCPNYTIGHSSDRKSVNYSGDLSAGQTSCTLSIDVTSTVAGTYINGPDNLQNVVGLHLPANADVTFVAGAPNTGAGQIIQSRPLIVAGATLAATGALLYTRKRITQ